MQGLEFKPSKKMGCKAKLIVRVYLNDLNHATIEINGEHSHKADLRLRQLHPSMRQYVLRCNIFYQTKAERCYLALGGSQIS